MGSKGGSQTRPVYDYHLSLDYGVCMGRIDHMNKGWIKDKTIFCGTYRVRTDLEINLPELFGGDDAEGGVRGIAELYMGWPTQYSSWELTKRMGLNPATAPAYRGISHVFFRGALDDEVTQGELDALGEDELNIWQQLRYVVVERIGQPLTSAALALGWKWASNNPYFPDAKINATRLPKKGYTDPYKAIWPGSHIDDNGNIVGLASVTQVGVGDGGDGAPDEEIDGAFPIGLTNGGDLDLFEIGFNQTEIDAGAAKITSDWTVQLRSYNTYGTTDSTLTTEIRFYSQKPVDGWDSAFQITPVSGEEALVSNDVVVTMAPATRERGDSYPSSAIGNGALPVVTAPVGSRYIRVRGTLALGTDVVALAPAETGNYHDEWLYDNPNAGYTPGSYGDGNIRVTEGPPVVVPDPEPVLEYEPPKDEVVVLAQGRVTVKEMPPTKKGDIIDLLALGLTVEDIESGTISVNISFAGNTYATIPAVPGDDTNASCAITQHETPPEFWYSTDGLPSASVLETGVSTFNQSLSLVLDPAARYIQLRAAWTPSVGKKLNIVNNGFTITYMDYGTYHCAADDLIGPLPDANPARIIYDCLTDGEWGKGEDPSMIDDASFEAAAQALFNERFGLSFAYFEQDTIENFISEVLDHIKAFLFQDPSTGLWTLRLLRGDYDAASMPLLDESNCIAENRKRRLWGETINEIVVSYTDPNTEKPTTVAAQDLGNIAVQGGVISETREYYGIRNPLLAQVVAQRDVREAGYPLFSAQIKVSRKEFAIRPGDIRRFSWAEDQIEELVVRVMSVDYGKPSDRTITLNVMEDIFSIEQAQYGSPQTTEWVNVQAYPTPLDAQIAFTAPLPSLVRAGGDIDEIDAAYPSVTGALLGDEDGSVKPDMIEIHSEVVRSNGSANVQKITEVTPTYSSLLMRELAQEATSTIQKSQIDAILRRPGEEGEMFMLGFNEPISEVIMLESYNATTREWTVARGMWDTVPLAWPRGVRLWLLEESGSSVDPKDRASGESRTYYMLPRTSLGVLEFDDAVPLTVTYTDRPFAPFRPADAQLDGQGFGGVVQRTAPFPTSIEATWKNRNRTTEDQVALSWTDDSAAMEAGQTVTLRILDDLGNIHDEITGLTGESHTISAALLPPGLEGYIQFLSERDGFVSLWGARRYFDIRPPSGYGLAYGLDYGGEQ